MRPVAERHRAESAQLWSPAQDRRPTSTDLDDVAGQGSAPRPTPVDHGACRTASLKETPHAAALRPALTEAPASAHAKACRLRGECRSCPTKANAGQRREGEAFEKRSPALA
jgi:hypothetical protein